jgi:hypothetical protein
MAALRDVLLRVSRLADDLPRASRRRPYQPQDPFLRKLR